MKTKVHIVLLLAVCVKILSARPSAYSYSSYDSTYDDGDDSTYDDGDDSTYDDGDDSTYDDGDDSTYDHGDDSTYDDGDDSTYDDGSDDEKSVTILIILLPEDDNNKDDDTETVAPNIDIPVDNVNTNRWDNVESDYTPATEAGD